MLKNNTKLIIGLGYESSILVQKTETSAEKFCLDFSTVYYPKFRDLTKYKDNYNLIQEDDFWWCGEDIFENLKEPVFQDLIKNKKAIVIVVSEMGQKEAGFVNAFIRFAKGKKVILILNKNRLEDSLYRHFMKICKVIDTFYTVEYQEKFYDKEYKIKPHTSILEMQACLNMSFMKRIEETLSKCTKGLRNLTKDERTRIIEDAHKEAEMIINNAKKRGSRNAVRK